MTSAERHKAERQGRVRAGVQAVAAPAVGRMAGVVPDGAMEVTTK